MIARALLTALFLCRRRCAPWSIGSVLFAACVCCPALVFGQDNAAPKQPDRSAVIAAVEELQSRRFVVRQQAETRLWKMGPSIEPILAELIDESDLETRLRIKSVRLKFELGVTPEMPTDVSKLIMDAITSSSDRHKREATKQLVAKQQFAAVMGILKRLKAGTGRAEYLTTILPAMRTQKPSPRIDDFYFDLLRWATTEPNQRERINLVRSVLRDTQVRRRASSGDWIEKFIDLVSNTSDQLIRRTMIDSIYFSSTTKLGAKHLEVLTKWINLVAEESDRSVRQRHVAKLLSTSTLMRSYSQSSSNKLDLAALFNRLKPEGKNALLDATTQVPFALQRLHKSLGDDVLLKAAGSTDDQALRGNLTGRLAAIQSWPSANGDDHRVLSLIDKEDNEEARQQIVVGFVQGLAKVSTGATSGVVSQECNEIWAMLNTDEERAWQLPGLLESYASNKIFEKYHSDETIRRMFRVAEVADTKAVLQFSYAPVTNRELGVELGKHNLSLDFLKTLNGLGQHSSLTGRFSSLLGSTRFTENFDQAEKRDALLEFCRNDVKGRAAYYAASGLMRNKALTKTLLEDGQFEKLKKTLVHCQTESRRTDLLGRLLASESTIRFLAKEGRVSEIFNFDRDDLPKGSRDTVLQLISVDDDAVEALHELGQFNALVAAILKIEKQDHKDRCMKNLTSRKTYAKILASKGALSKKIHELAADKNWVSRRGYMSLIANLTIEDVQNEPKLAAELWQFAMKLESQAQKTCFRALFSSPWFVSQASNDPQAAEIYQSIFKSMGVNDYRLALNQAAQTQHAAAFLKVGSLNSLVVAAKPLSAEYRAAVYRSLGQSSFTRKWFESTEQPKTLFGVIDSVQDADERGRCAAALLTSGMLSNQSKNTELIEQVIQFALKQPKEARTNIAVGLLSQYTLFDAANKSPLADLVLQKAESETLTHEELLVFLRSSYLARALKERGKERGLLDRAFSSQGGERRDELVMAALSNRYLHTALTDQELRSSLDEVLAKPQTSRSRYWLVGSSELLRRMIDIGYFEKLVDVIDSDESSDSMRWSFYASPVVAGHLAKSERKADKILELIKECPANVARSRAMQLTSNSVTIRWLLDSHGWPALRELLDRADDRPALLRFLVSNSLLITEMARRDLLKPVFDEVDADDTVTRSNFINALFNSRVQEQLKDPTPFFELLKTHLDRSSGPQHASMVARLRGSSFQKLAFKHGQGRWVLETLLADPKLIEPAELRASMNSSNSLYAIALRLGELAKAQSILEKIADDDLGMLRLIRFGLIRSEYDETFDLSTLDVDGLNAEQRKRFEFYLARAMGEPAPDPTPAMQWSRAMELHQWGQLAKMPLCRARELPAPSITKDINPNHRRIEELGFRIAFGQLSGGDVSADVASLSEWIDQHSSDKNSVRYGADALLATGRPEAALALLEKHMPRRAFYWHWERMDYDRALRVIGWRPGESRTLYDSIAAENGDPAAATSRATATGFMLQVASLLRSSGRDKGTREVIEVLAQYIDDEAGSASERSNKLNRLAVELRRLGFKKEGRELIAKAYPNKMVPDSYFSAVYHSSIHTDVWREAKGWWATFLARYPGESVEELLSRVDDVTSAEADIDTILPLMRVSDEDRAKLYAPVTLLRYERYGELRQLLKSQPEMNRDSMVLMGRVAMAEESYAEAAKWFYEAWQSKTTDLPRLYLAGDCWKKAGNAKKADECHQLARLAAIRLESSFGFAAGLKYEDMTEQALETYKVMRRTAPPSHRLYVYALYRVAMETDDMTLAAKLRLEHSLYHLRPTLSHSNLKNWIYFETKLRAVKALAAVDAGDFDNAERHWRDATKINLGAGWMAEPLVVGLRKQGQPELANKILGAHRDYFVDRAAKYPQSKTVKKRFDLLLEQTGVSE